MTKDATGGPGTSSTILDTLRSSTGNTNGIYDLNGNAAEFVAAFNKAYVNVDIVALGFLLSASGGCFASTDGSSTKYATAYSNSTSKYNATNLSDFDSIGDVSFVGDAIREVWVKNYYGWFSDISTFVSSGGASFLERGRWS